MSRSAITGSTTCSRTSGDSSSLRSMSGACCAETTTVSSRTGLSPAYSMVTCVLPSGRRYGTSPVRQHDGQWHEFRGFPACIPEHQALVPRALAVEFGRALTLPVLEGIGDAPGDVGRLCADGDRDSAGAPVVSLG